MSDVEVLSAAKKAVKSLKRRRPKRGDKSSSDESSDDGGLDEVNRNHGDDEQRRLERKSEEEMQLESLVFGAEFSVISGDGRKDKTFSSREKASSSKQPIELADNFIERKPVWQDDDDQAEK